MTIGHYLLRRLAFALLLVLLVSSAAFLLTRLAPGDFTIEQGLTITAEERARLAADLGLDRPLAVQYGAWLGRAVRLDFGPSFLYSRPVADLLGERAANTAVLALAALIVATVLGVPAGVLSGRRAGATRRVVRGVSLLLLSVPPLVSSLVLVWIAARTGWLPLGGMTSLASDGSWSGWVADLARHLPLPVLALALPVAATLERLQSQALAEASREPFVAAAVARGLSWDRAVAAHAWPASLRAVLSVYGLIIGALFSGSFIVEVVTAWPGLGRLMYDALRARDLYLVAGCAATGAAFLAVGTLVSDLLLRWADPRLGGGGVSR
ncbi:MAG: ABC transporter permease [Vicinamibacterales bacterium]|nr:ABC transporter permease [Vicinamibacterales bacterium]